MKNPILKKVEQTAIAIGIINDILNRLLLNSINFIKTNRL